ncbi:VCBS repeat-containing protein [Actinopolymorpha sp. B11F2]|uniref:FG-GAP repeat domain-containing protein n=1 Tax=Actinopolymorpha sp. B11F2 TaxID=3160862 RepID=UPI0032E4829E
MRLDSTERCRALAVDGECGLQKKVRVDGQDVVLTAFQRGEGGGPVDVPVLNDALLEKLAERFGLEACGIDCGLFLGDFGIGNFDGDTHADLAVAFEAFHPDMSDDRLGAGIAVMSGGRNGLQPGSVALVEAGGQQLGDALEAYESLWGVAAGDVDGDGADDLALGVIALDPEFVRAIVLYESPDGLGQSRRAQTWQPGHNEGDYGAPVAFGDFDSDGYSDLVIGSPHNESVGVIYGSRNGLTEVRTQEWSKDSPGMPRAGEPGVGLGNVLAVGDFNGDGADDLATAGRFVPENVLVLYGGVASGSWLALGSAGLTARRLQLWTPDAGGLPTGVQADDGALSVGWFGGSDHLDLAVVNRRYGERTVLLGSPDGLVTN